MVDLTLRGLDPNTDLSLFEEAYSWRPKKGKAQAGQMPFDDFLKSSAVMGLFNGEFLAVYTISEYEKGCFDLHFTSKRQMPREYLIAGGIQITKWLVENGALEVSAIIIAHNRTLRKFLEDCGYTAFKSMMFSNSPHRWIKFIANHRLLRYTQPMKGKR